MNKFFFLILLIAFKAGFSFGQTFPTRHFTDKDGLPNNNIQVIFKDSRGVLWIGTNAGLCTYDGNSFKPFDFMGYDKSNKIWTIEEDEYGNMYFGTFGSGLIKYDGKNFTQYLNNGTEPRNHIRHIKYSSLHKCLYVATEDGFSILKDSVLINYPLIAPKQKKRERSMTFIERGDTVFFYTFTGGTHYYLHSDKKVYFLDKNHPLFLHSSSKSCMDSAGNILQGIFQNGFRYIKKDTSLIYSDLGQVFDFKENSHHEIWLAAWSYYSWQQRGGFFRLRNDSLEFMNPKLSIQTKMAWCIYYDAKNDLYWLGTNGDGIYLYKDNGVVNYDASCFGMKELDCWDIKNVYNELFISADNCVIIGNDSSGFKTYDDLEIINKTPDYKKYENRNYIETIKDAHINNKVPSRISKFFAIEQTNNDIWIGSVNGYFYRNIRDSIFNFFPGNRVMCENFKIVNDTSIYGCGYGALKYIPNYLKDTQYHKSQDKQTPKDISRMVKVDNRLWFASWNRGMYSFCNGVYYNYSIDVPGMSMNLTDLCKDNNNHLIAGTNNGEVHIMSFENDSLLINYKIKDEIKGNSVRWLLADSKSNLWIGTNLGLNIISLDSLYKKDIVYSRFFDDMEGFYERDVRRAIEDDKGNIWIAGHNSIVKINPELFLSPNTKSGVELKNIFVNNEAPDWKKNGVETDSWTHLPTGSFKLPYDKNSIIIEYQTSNFYDQDKDYYSCMLEGFDSKFSPWNKEKKVNYTNLDPGKYTLFIKNKNISTGKEGNVYALSFTILRPFWKTWWFYLCSILIIGFGIWWIVTNKIKNIRQKEINKREIEKQITTLKTQAIQAQLNPHFIFNAITSVQSFMLSNDMEAAMDYLVLFADLIRKTLDLVSEHMISLDSELGYLENYVKIESMRFVGGIEFVVNVDGDIDEEEVQIPPLLLQPFVENAIKHGLSVLRTEKKITVKIASLGDKTLTISITDNGIGRQKSNKYKAQKTNYHKSKGLSITNERIQQMTNNGNMDNYGVVVEDLYTDDMPVGTRVIVTIPIS